ncbi:PRC-barrel domain-containing protein [Jiella endophytica]|nr:PRC-barrel domain-containing protein [Jiella endophytica]
MFRAAVASLFLAGMAGQSLAQDAGTAPDASADAPADTSAATGGAATSGAAAGVLAPIEDDNAPVPQLNLMVGQVEDMDLVGPNDEEVGEIDGILGDANGSAKAITVDVGGFLGIGEKTIILMLSDLSLDMGRIKTKLTKDEIEKLPAFGG